jgi:hypothetical protein
MSRPYFPDFSHYQKWIDLSVQDPIAGWMKFSEGVLDYLNDYAKVHEIYQGLLEQLRTRKIQGGYHYNRSNHKGYYPWQKQAETYLGAVDGLDLDFHVADAEGTNNYLLATPAFRKRHKINRMFHPNFGSDTIKWMRRIKKETGKKVFIYCGRYRYVEIFTWHGHVIDHDEFPLVIAQYPYKNWSETLRELPDDTDRWNPVLPAGVGPEDWKYWQYTGKYPGGNEKMTGSRDLDMSVYNGTESEMLQYFGKDIPEPPPVDPPTTPNDDYQNGYIDGREDGIKEGEENAAHKIRDFIDDEYLSEE